MRDSRKRPAVFALPNYMTTPRHIQQITTARLRIHLTPRGHRRRTVGTCGALAQRRRTPSAAHGCAAKPARRSGRADRHGAYVVQVGVGRARASQRRVLHRGDVVADPARGQREGRKEGLVCVHSPKNNTKHDSIAGALGLRAGPWSRDTDFRRTASCMTSAEGSCDTRNWHGSN